jgi:hypothetical protein
VLEEGGQFGVSFLREEANGAGQQEKERGQFPEE